MNVEAMAPRMPRHRDGHGRPAAGFRPVEQAPEVGGGLVGGHRRRAGAEDRGHDLLFGRHGMGGVAEDTRHRLQPEAGLHPPADLWPAEPIGHGVTTTDHAVLAPEPVVGWIFHDV